MLGDVDLENDLNLPGHAECMIQRPDVEHGVGTGWAVLADPEGNEFGILRSEAEVPADG